MQWMILAAALTAEPAFVERFANQEMAARAMAQEVTTGTLLFSQGDCLAVQIYTKSAYTHVGAVVVKDGKAWVYDSAKGQGVRKQELQEYLSFLRQDVMHVFQPHRKFSRSRAEEFIKHLDSQIGKPYAISHHLTGDKSDGLHCSEYVTQALMAANLLTANKPCKVSPASLVQGITQAELYSAVKTIELQPEPTPKGEGTCSQWWIDTKVCTKNCWLKMKGWVFCQ